ncbi:hypothetical protein [Ottowia sp.]|uniref:hypothetical protein n=1 Tax=Ottowia sp. TaxID=1898956 RepID=UPI002C1332BF|nr:hypothetical protein [Ottowia sp.]HOB65410.1 hypothetical protein [Ottowia sp.]HPZ56919.1 hypothetical protein [Ottowia sp.]HQD46505.1 hypothetical protein [Ottowia sp.]
MQNVGQISLRRRAAAVLCGMALAAAVLPASAQDRVSGVLSQGCALHWHAKSTLLNGGSLTGFDQTVSTAAGEPGWMENQHWNWTADLPMYWRFVVATDYAINNATLTVKLPPAGGAWVMDNTDLVDWVTARANLFYPGHTFAWSVPAAAPTANPDGTLTFHLGNLPAHSGIIFLYTAPLDPALGRGPYEAIADLRGTYTVGNPASCQPAPVPVNSPWALLGLGALSALAAGWQLRRRA